MTLNFNLVNQHSIKHCKWLSDRQMPTTVQFWFWHQMWLIYDSWSIFGFGWMWLQTFDLTFFLLWSTFGSLVELNVSPDVNVTMYWCDIDRKPMSVLQLQLIGLHVKFEKLSVVRMRIWCGFKAVSCSFVSAVAPVWLYLLVWYIDGLWSNVYIFLFVLVLCSLKLATVSTDLDQIWHVVSP